MRTYYYHICDSLNANGLHRFVCLFPRGKHSREGTVEGTRKKRREERMEMRKIQYTQVWGLQNKWKIFRYKSQSTGLTIPNLQTHAIWISTLLPLNCFSISFHSYLGLTTTIILEQSRCNADIWNHRQLQSSSSVLNTYTDDRHWCFLFETRTNLSSPSKMCL